MRAGAEKDNKPTNQQTSVVCQVDKYISKCEYLRKTCTNAETHRHYLIIFKMMRRLSPAWGWCLVTNRVKEAHISIWEAINLENKLNGNVSLHLCVRQSLSWCWPAGATSPRAAWRTWVSAASAPPPSPWRTCSPPGYTSQWVCPSPTVICSVNIYTCKIEFVRF